MFLRSQTFAYLFAFAILGLAGEASGFQSIQQTKPPAKIARLEGQLDRLREVKSVLEATLEDGLAKAADLERKLTELKWANIEQVVASESYPDVIKSLHSQRVQLMISVAGLEARRKAILAATEQVTNKTVDEELLKPLQESVKIRSEMYQTAMSQEANNEISKSIVLQAQLAMLNAQSRLAEVKSNARSSETLDRLTASLLDSSLELAEQKAMLAETESLVNRIEPAQRKFQEVEEVRNSMSSTQQAINVAQAQLNEVKVKISNFTAELEELKGQGQ